MIASLFSYVQDDIQEDYSILNLKNYLFKAGALQHFETIYEDYPQSAEKIIAYLIYAYSFDSTFVVSGEDWLETKRGIMELVKLDTAVFSEVLNMKKQSIKTAIIFLSKEVKDYRFHQLVIWKESAAILDEIATTYPDIEAKSTSKNISDAAKFSYELRLKSTALENEIKQQTKSSTRLKEVQTLNIENLSMEAILKSIK